MNHSDYIYGFVWTVVKVALSRDYPKLKSLDHKCLQLRARGADIADVLNIPGVSNKSLRCWSIIDVKLVLLCSEFNNTPLRKKSPNLVNPTLVLSRAMLFEIIVDHVNKNYKSNRSLAMCVIQLSQFSDEPGWTPVPLMQSQWISRVNI